MLSGKVTINGIDGLERDRLDRAFDGGTFSHRRICRLVPGRARCNLETKIDAPTGALNDLESITSLRRLRTGASATCAEDYKTLYRRLQAEAWWTPWASQ